MESVEVKTTGMHCGSCKMLVEMDLNELAGVSLAEADLGSGVTHVEFDPTEVTIDKIVATIEGAGYVAEVVV